MPYTRALLGLSARAATALVALTFAASASAQFDPRALYPQYPETQIIYYDVAGGTPWEVRRQIALRGPRAVDGQRVDAQTRWAVGWTLRPAGPDSCEATIEFETTISLPRLLDDSAFTAQDRLAWENYMLALIDHEYGHVEIAHSALPDLQYALEGGSCEGANARGRAVVDETNWAQIQFDRDTSHGQLTGVKFP